MRSYQIASIAALSALVLPALGVAAPKPPPMSPVLLEQTLAVLGEYGGPINGKVNGTVTTALHRFESAWHLPQGGLTPQVQGALVWAAGQNHPLALGSQGRRVELLQWRLNQSGLPAGATDGVFGPETAAAVRKFQAQTGVSVTGKVDNTTWAALARFSVTVAPGDTVSGIATRYGVTPTAIATLNGMKDPNQLLAGSQLLLTPPGAPVSSPTTSQNPAAKAPVEQWVGGHRIVEPLAHPASTVLPQSHTVSLAVLDAGSLGLGTAQALLCTHTPVTLFVTPGALGRGATVIKLFAKAGDGVELLLNGSPSPQAAAQATRTVVQMTGSFPQFVLVTGKLSGSLASSLAAHGQYPVVGSTLAGSAPPQGGEVLVLPQATVSSLNGELHTLQTDNLTPVALAALFYPAHNLP